MSSLPLLCAQGISRRYGPRIAVAEVSLTLPRGEVLGLLGLNGAGKSTTLQILAGVLAPHTGRVSIHGHDLARAPIAAKRHLGYLPENAPLFREATVDEYLAFCARLHEVPRGVVSWLRFVLPRKGAVPQLVCCASQTANGCRVDRSVGVSGRYLDWMIHTGNGFHFLS